MGRRFSRKRVYGTTFSSGRGHFLVVFADRARSAFLPASMLNWVGWVALIALSAILATTLGLLTGAWALSVVVGVSLAWGAAFSADRISMKRARRKRP